MNSDSNTCLHLLMGADPGLVDDCLASWRSGDQLLLVDRGVALLCEAELLGRLRQACGETVGALEPDVRARGLGPLLQASGVACIGLQEWVELIARHPQILSWR